MFLSSKVGLSLLTSISLVFSSPQVLGLSVGGCGIWILLGSGSFLNVLPSGEKLHIIVLLHSSVTHDNA